MLQEQRVDIFQTILSKREQILQLAAQRKAYHVRVFGSVARHEADQDSDVDFLVDFQPDYSLWDHIGLIQDLQALLGRKVDVAIEKNLHEKLRPAILRDAREL
ncbi:MAG: nucleotidyltransferase domain-containing protein [Chloroflexi bacterium]|nr:nucleotidyltransferase domain-containing protein [Chloroflexota bacterium]